MTEPLPALFVSHGSPMLALEADDPAHAHLTRLGDALPRPRAILVATAHWETARPTVATAAAPETIHDFWGFPDALYALRYPAPGAPEVARRARALLAEAGIAADEDGARGFDHGTWVPLLLTRPAADVPVAQISIQPDADPAAHLAIGRALAPLRAEGVLIVGSGSATHDLRGMTRGRPTGETPAYVQGFADWLDDRIRADDRAALTDYLAAGPEARRNHPTPEHILPLFVAMGAAAGPGRALHRSYRYGALAMDVHAWG